MHTNNVERMDDSNTIGIAAIRRSFFIKEYQPTNYRYDMAAVPCTSYLFTTFIKLF